MFVYDQKMDKNDDKFSNYQESRHFREFLHLITYSEIRIRIQAFGYTILNSDPCFFMPKTRFKKIWKKVIYVQMQKFCFLDLIAKY